MLNKSFMTITDDAVIVSMTIMSTRVTETFKFSDFNSVESAMEEADRFVEIRKSLLRKNQSGEVNIRESVSKINNGHYLYLQFYKGKKLHKSISVGRLFNTTTFGRRLIRNSPRYSEAIRKLVKERDGHENIVEKQEVE